jgi:hypothetical protein
MTKAVIVDMDGTLDMGGGKVNAAMAARLREYDAAGVRVIIVSARRERRLAETRDWLAANDIPHSAVHLNDFPPASGQIPFKRYKVKLLAERYEIVAAYENDAAVRAAYRKLGINAKAPLR